MPCRMQGMAGRSSFHLVDRILDGHLAEFLTEARANGQSFETIARDLYIQFDIEISSHAIRRWVKALENDVVIV